MTEQEFSPYEPDVDTPNAARMYDYYLGGKDNYPADREAAEKIMALGPSRDICIANRRFLGRAVRLAAQSGIRQFLDLGTGLPTQDNVHEVAKRVAPGARVVYVDYDPVVLAHARALLKSSKAGATQYVDADLRDTGTILRQAGRLLDFTKPVAVTLLMILHVIPDSDDPHAIVARLMRALPPGSCLAVTHLGAELLDQEKTEGFQGVVRRQAQQQYIGRSREEFGRFFDGMDLVEPGVVRVEEWRPEQEPEGRSALWCAVGRKR